MTFEELATKEDLLKLKEDLITELTGLSSPAPKWVRREEASKILGIGYDTLTKLRAEGKIRAAKTNRIVFYNIQSLYDYLDSQSASFKAST